MFVPRQIPTKVVEAYEYENALEILTDLALAFDVGGWDFEQACSEAKQAMIRNSEEI